MDLTWLEVIMLLFATIGPLKVTIVCANLTAEAPPEFLRQVARRSVLIATSVCLLFVVVGELILKVFGVSVPAFQLGGGLIVLLFSIQMAMESKKATRMDAGAGTALSEFSLDMATYPLAIPLMASISGLVAIVTVISQGNTLPRVMLLTAIILAMMALDYVCLRKPLDRERRGGGHRAGRQQDHGSHPGRPGH